MELLRTRQAALLSGGKEGGDQGNRRDRLEVGARSVEGSNDVRTAATMQVKR